MLSLSAPRTWCIVYPQCLAIRKIERPAPSLVSIPPHFLALGLLALICRWNKAQHDADSGCAQATGRPCVPRGTTDGLGANQPW